MLKIWIGTSTSPKEYVVDPNTTVTQALSEAGQRVKDNSVVSLNSRRLSKNELNMTLAQLYVQENDSITITTKMMSA